MRTAFEKAATEVTNDEGVGGSVEFESHVDYESFRLPEDHLRLRKPLRRCE